MTYEAQNYKKYKDPFATQPFPKSFYHPSPTKKDVDEAEVIHSPERKYDPTPLKAVEDRFLRGGLTYKTSALPSVAALNNQTSQRPERDLLKTAEGGTASDLCDETWPECERSASLSISRNDSHITSATDVAGTDPTRNISELVRGLERMKFHQNSSGLKGKKEDDKPNITGESVLQRYVDRFRNSAPKSREEREKEKEAQKEEFWWLQSSPASTANTTWAEDEKRTKHRHNHDSSHSRTGQSKLTREALLAMDEETMHLQSKADQLLYKSQLSLASSGPIVSTEGLGTSTSISDSTVSEDQPPYRPAFVRAQESYHRPAPKPLARREEQAASRNMLSKSPGDDILARWRLQRKMEEASVVPSAVRHGKGSNQRQLKNTEAEARLQEFRKKILTQRALVTAEDIQFERQRMAMLVEEEAEDGGIQKREIPVVQKTTQQLEPLRDPILERLHKITGTTHPMPFSEDTTHGMAQQKTLISPHYGGDVPSADTNFNNAGMSGMRVAREGFGHSLSHPGLNKNNTASSDQQTPRNLSANNSREPEFTVDSFGSQEVCDPRTRVFVLGKGSHDASVSDSAHNGIVSDSERVRDRESFTAVSKGAASDKSERGGSLPQEADQQRCTEAEKVVINESHSDGNAKTVKTVRLEKNNDIGEDEKPVKVNDGDKTSATEKIYDKNIYHQFLVAEKPISDGNKSKREGKRFNSAEEERCVNDYTQQSFSKENKKTGSVKSERSMGSSYEQSDHGDVSDSKKYMRDQKKKKGKIRTPLKKDKGTEEDIVTESETLTDITNESDALSRSSDRHQSGISSPRNISGKQQSHQSKAAQSHSAKPQSKAGHREVDYELRPNRHSAGGAASGPGSQRVNSAIGQAITDHVFDGSTLISSVDSWASMFPQSPAPTRSLYETGVSTPSPSPSQRENTPLESTPLQSTPITVASSDQQVVGEEEYQSDGEFEEDPLLVLLRQQRNQYLQKLESVERKLQEIDAGS